MRLGELLIERGVITPHQLDLALTAQPFWSSTKCTERRIEELARCVRFIHEHGAVAGDGRAAKASGQ